MYQLIDKYVNLSVYVSLLICKSQFVTICVSTCRYISVTICLCIRHNFSIYASQFVDISAATCGYICHNFFVCMSQLVDIIMCQLVDICVNLLMLTSVAPLLQHSLFHAVSSQQSFYIICVHCNKYEFMCVIK